MNEIITYGNGYELHSGIKVLVKSAKNLCDKFTVICSSLSPQTMEFLREQNVNIVDAKEIAVKHNVSEDLSPYTLKVIYFYLYCKHYCKSSKVYMCDFTDVLFQKNPFNIIKNNKPYVITENTLIGNCNVNTDWMHLCFNGDIFNLLKHKEIINGGMYFGTLESITFLLSQMTLELQQIISRIGNYLIPDQAALNKLVYFDQLRYNILNGFDLFNMAHFSKLPYSNTDNGLYKFGENIPTVIHQYKANKTLEQQVYNQFN
jgi:hypothetical protein